MLCGDETSKDGACADSDRPGVDGTPLPCDEDLRPVNASQIDMVRGKERKKMTEDSRRRENRNAASA